MPPLPEGIGDAATTLTSRDVQGRPHNRKDTMMIFSLTHPAATKVLS